MITFSQLQLERYDIRSLKMVETLCKPASGKREKASLKIDVTHTVEDNSENPNAFSSELRVRIVPQTVPPGAGKMLAFDIEVVGLFRIDGECSAEMGERFRSQSAPAILYGVCRGICGMMTGVSTLGRNELPTLNLMRLPMKRKKGVSRAALRRPDKKDERGTG